MPASSTFALSPFLSTAATATVIDYTTKAGKELYAKATEVLDSEAFSLDQNDCLALLDLLADWAASMGWDREGGCLLIPDDNGVKRNLISEYAQLTTENVDAHEATVMASESRESQES